MKKQKGSYSLGCIIPRTINNRKQLLPIDLGNKGARVQALSNDIVTTGTLWAQGSWFHQTCRSFFSIFPVFQSISALYWQNLLIIEKWGLPWWLSSKESACNAEDAGDQSLIPGSGRSPEGGHGKPLQALPGESHGQRTLAGYRPRLTKSQTQLKWLRMHTR